MMIDIYTKNAIRHTLHCLLGCSIGEVLGMVIGSGWSNVIQTTLSIVLAFVFGYGLTFRSILKTGASKKQALKGALATDTASISSMEFVDNAFIWIVPGAIHAGLSSWLFWWSLTASLVIAFIFTVPVNRFLMTRSSHTHTH